MERKRFRGIGAAVALLGSLLCSWGLTPGQVAARQAFRVKLVAAAVERANHYVRYDPKYVAIPYPNGDVPAATGVCSDEIIRIYRAVGVDLQKEVHEDIVRVPAAYSKRHADANIDHRRVENLMIFFRRHGDSLPITRNDDDYRPGEVVTWDLHNGKGRLLGHVGMVVDRQSQAGKRYMIVHNIGDGPQIEDVLFAWKITGHYMYYGSARQ
jgi:uncharacterized protein YijF (DUF1287 family)